MEIGFRARTVLACRVSPKQKGEIISHYKAIEKKKSVMAIGDGANDVTMITIANVGIGINGQEGSQAARSADFAIGEFQNLMPLMFFFGREYYRRNTFLLKYIIYRVNVLWVGHFWWGFLSGGNG